MHGLDNLRRRLLAQRGVEAQACRMVRQTCFANFNEMNLQAVHAGYFGKFLLAPPARGASLMEPLTKGRGVPEHAGGMVARPPLLCQVDFGCAADFSPTVSAASQRRHYSALFFAHDFFIRALAASFCACVHFRRPRAVFIF